MFTYNIKIYERNETTSIKVDSLSYTIKLDESLDSGVLTIPRASRKRKFDRFSRLEISINDGESVNNTTWLTYNTKVEIDSRGSEKTYNHTVAFIEPTKWLEKFVVGTLTFTQLIGGTQRTLYDYVERVRQLVPFVKKNEIVTTRLFRIDNTFRTKIENVIAPQIYLDKKNLREVLIELFKVVNAIPRLYYDNGWVLTGDFINQRQLEIEIGDGDIDYIQEASGENFAQSAEVFQENTVVEKPIYEGSIVDYISFRNNSVILGESDLRLILSEKVSSIDKFIALIKRGGEIVEIDLTSNLYEKNEYDTLDFTGGLGTKETSLYWDYKSNEIRGFSETFDSIFQDLAITKLLDEYNIDDLLDYKDYSFRVEYKPFYDTMRSIQYRENFEPYALQPEMLDEYSGLIINQSERINELFDITSNIYGQIQRIGVDTVSISKKHYKFSEVYNYGDYTSDNYIVTKVEVIPYTTYLIARYELSKNWNRIAQFIQIDKEFRPYEISLVKTNLTLKRDILINIGFVEISNESKDNTLKTLFSNSDNFIEKFMNTFKVTNHQTPITLMKFKKNVNEFGGDAIVKPLGAFAEKNNLKWKVNFQDTKLAGKRVTRETFGLSLVERLIQRQIHYTDSFGRLDSLNIALLENLWTYYTKYQEVSETYEIIRELADNLPYLNDYYNVVTDHINESNRYLRIENNFIFERRSEFPTVENGVLGELYVAKDEEIVYELFADDYYFYADLIALKKENVIELPEYKVLKDGAEVLGLEIYLPVLPKYDLVDNFVVGDSLLKENCLVKALGSAYSPVLYFYGLEYAISKSNTDKIDLSRSTQIIGLGYLSGTVLNVPSSVYVYDSYALADSEGNLYIGVNQRNADGTKTVIDEIHFNFLNERTYPHYSGIVESLTLTLEFVDSDYVNAILAYQENETYTVEELAFNDSDVIALTLSSFEYEELTLQLAFNDSDIINAQLLYKDLETLVMGLVFRDSDTINAQLSGFEKEQLNLDLSFNDNDRIDAIAMLYEYEEMSLQLAFHENDIINVEIDYKLQTTAPTLNFVSWVQKSSFYEYRFQAINKDDFTAEIFTGLDDTPTTSQGIIASQGSVDIVMTSIYVSLTVYAKAKATDKLLSEAVSVTGSVT